MTHRAPSPRFSRFRTIAGDRLRFSRTVRYLLFHWRYLTSRLASAGPAEKTAQRVREFCAAARLATDPAQIERVEREIQRLIENHELDASSLLEGDTDHHITKALILKPYDPDNREKGVIFISFEYQWARLLLADPSRLEKFAQRYDLVLSPTWTPPHSLVNCAFPRFYPGTLYSLISNRSDLDTFPRLSKDYRMVNLFASSWVDPELFDPLPREERDIDIVMLANFGTYKRHHVLFRALRKLPRDLRVVLVGQPNGQRTAEVLLAEAQAFGVEDRIELRQRVTDEEVTSLLCRAKVSLICSRREGSCVAVVESMFADTPVGLVEGAQIGSAAFVNSSTGRFLDERRFAEELAGFLQQAEEMNPRQWCLENALSAIDSSRMLNAQLKKDALAEGGPWTRDLISLHWRPNPEPLSERPSWLGPEQERIFELTGIRIGQTLDPPGNP